MISKIDKKVSFPSNSYSQWSVWSFCSSILSASPLGMTIKSTSNPSISLSILSLNLPSVSLRLMQQQLFKGSLYQLSLSVCFFSDLIHLRKQQKLKCSDKLLFCWEYITAIHQTQSSEKFPTMVFTALNKPSSLCFISLLTIFHSPGIFEPSHNNLLSDFVYRV